MSEHSEYYDENEEFSYPDDHEFEDEVWSDDPEESSESNTWDGVSKPREDDFEDYVEFMDALTDWKINDRIQRQGSPGPAPPSNEEVASAIAHHRQAIGDDSDPHGSERAQLTRDLADCLNKAATAQAAGDLEDVNFYESLAAESQKDLDELPVHPLITKAEQDNIADLERIVDVATDPENMKSLVESYGFERVLQDSRIKLNDLNRLSDGQYVWVIEGDSETYGPPEQIKIRKIDLGSSEEANRAKTPLAHNSLWDVLVRYGHVQPAASNEVTSAPEPITPSSGAVVIEKDPDSMSQAEFEAWYDKEYGAPKTTSALHVGR